MGNGLKKLCALVEELKDRLYPESPADCFCGDSPFKKELTDPFVSENIVDFIEQAVRKELRSVGSSTGRDFQPYEYQRVVDSISLLLVEGKKPWKIGAIKLLREQYGYGLKDCKNLVEAAERLGYIELVTEEGDNPYPKIYYVPTGKE